MFHLLYNFLTYQKNRYPLEQPDSELHVCIGRKKLKIILHICFSPDNEMNLSHETDKKIKQLELLEREVQNLNRMLLIKRRNISDCAQELISYCLDNEKNDAFLNKIPSSKNPFRDTGGLGSFKNCQLL